MNYSISNANDPYGLKIKGSGSIRLSIKSPSGKVLRVQINYYSYALLARFNIISLSYLINKAKFKGE